MDLIASFNALKVRTSHFLTVDGILKDGVLHFLFDTGAAVSLIGLNCLFPEDEHRKITLLESIVKDELSSQQVVPRPDPYKTANNQNVTTFPCVSHGVSIEGAKAIDFYYDFSFDDVSLPLLGTTFSEDCAYHHTIGGMLTVTGIKENPGLSIYQGINVLDFDIVIKQFEKEMNS